MEVTIPQIDYVRELLRESDVQDIEYTLRNESQSDLSTQESIVNGMYVRKITIPKGTFLTSKVWLEPYLDIMVAGDITVFTEYGTKRMTGLNVLPGRKLRKRVGVAHEDTVWITVHRTDDLVLDGLESNMTADSVEEGEAILSIEANDSYSSLLGYLGITEACVQNDMLIPVRVTDASIKESSVQGVGIFATRDYSVGEEIGRLTMDGVKTDYGRYTNHSPNPNTTSVYIGGDLVMIARQCIHTGEELLIDYLDNLMKIGVVKCHQ